MDLQKDNQKDKGVSALQYNPDLFHNDQQFYLSYRKIEHIVSALFLVTGLIEGNDLLKGEIRQHSLKCLSQITSLIGKPGVSVVDIQSVASLIIHLNSLLDIGFWAGNISQMNLAILQREISSAYQTLNDVSLKYKNSYYISSNFFKTNQELNLETHQNVFKASPMQSKEKDIKYSKDNKDKKTENLQRQKPAPVIPQNIRQENKRQLSSIVDGEQVIALHVEQTEPKKEADKGERRESILSLLRQKSNLTVKDFTTVVTAYSEKTIQRELVALVGEGIVRKEGERRWSTYSLAT